MSSLGAIDPIIVNRWSGFDQPETARVTPLLGDGTSTTGNAVIQQTALGYPVANVSGVITDSSDLDLLRGYADNKDTVTFSHGADGWAVIVFNLHTERVLVSGDATWTFSCTLHDVG